MKVLWITNVPFPDICSRLGLNSPVTGGWMKSLAASILKEDSSVKLAVATLVGNEYRKEEINEVVYYCLPFNMYQTDYNKLEENVWRKIKEDFSPDVVHIHGTEFPHGLAYIKACGVNNVVISIQGLVKAYARYSLGNIPVAELKRHVTFYDRIKRGFINLPSIMEAQGDNVEVEYIKMCKYIIGRTQWDKDHVWAINPEAKYMYCNESLRSPFYESNNHWELESCEKHSIFLSQAHKPIKGLHKVIEAMPYILRHYPDTKVYIAGTDFTKVKSIKDRLKFSTYANYICYLIKKYNLIDHFVFTGLLDEQQMAKRYKSSHIFVCPSSIENSPNSLGEAQILGVPVVASYVGGVPDMVEDKISGLLYRFEEHEMLAKCICDIFASDQLAKSLSKNGSMIAKNRHNRVENAINTLDIYKSIMMEIK